MVSKNFAQDAGAIGIREIGGICLSPLGGVGGRRIEVEEAGVFS